MKSLIYLLKLISNKELMTLIEDALEKGQEAVRSAQALQSSVAAVVKRLGELEEGGEGATAAQLTEILSLFTQTDASVDKSKADLDASLEPKMPGEELPPVDPGDGGIDL